MPFGIGDLATLPTPGAAIQRIVEVDGRELPEDVDSQIESVAVVDRLAMPDTFTIVFRDPDRDVLGRAGCEVGKKVTISTAALSEDVPEPLIEGEITSIEADYDSLGSRAVVRGYDLSHRLNAGRRTQTFQNVKYSDIARQIAKEAGLTPEVDESEGTFEHVIQPNQSDLDFLLGTAKRIGFDCRVEGETLKFVKPTESSTGPGEGDFVSTSPVQLVWNHNLLEFRARMSAAAQVADVKVRGWDADKKEAVIGQASVSATNADLSTKPGELADRIGGRTLVVVDRSVPTQEAADALAAAHAEQVGSAAFEAIGVAIGSPALKAGVAVSVTGVDPKLEGKWVVSSSRHEFGDGSYRTTIECTGRQDRSLHGVVTNGLASGTGGGTGDTARQTGLVIAIVTNNDDPDKRGRVKLAYPWLSDDVESYWARVAMPGAGADAGMVWIPQVGDEVLVGFEHGDIRWPYVLGGLWNGKDAAPLGDALFKEGKVKRSGFVSRKGHQVLFFDDDDASGIALLSQDGKFKVSLNETKGQLHIKADGKLVIEAKSLEIKVDTEAKLEAASVGIEASGQTTIKGATVAIN